MVRLVFRPYTQLRRSICTSESLRSSIRFSPDFNLARHSSPSFGSQRVCSCCSPRSEVDGKRRHCARKGSCLRHRVPFAFTAPVSLENSMTRTHVRLLGPCFKTGRRRRRPTRNREATRASEDTRYTRLLRYLAAPKLAKRGLAERIKPNFTQEPSSAPPVRCVNEGRNAAREDSRKHAEPLLVKNAQTKPTQA